MVKSPGKSLIPVQQAQAPFPMSWTCESARMQRRLLYQCSPPSSQAFLTKVWWGKMCVDNGLWRVIVCMLFFPFLYTSFITFRYLLQLGYMHMEAGSASASSSS